MRHSSNSWIAPISIGSARGVTPPNDARFVAALGVRFGADVPGAVVAVGGHANDESGFRFRRPVGTRRTARRACAAVDRAQAKPADGDLVSGLHVTRPGDRAGGLQPGNQRLAGIVECRQPLRLVAPFGKRADSRLVLGMISSSRSS